MADLITPKPTKTYDVAWTFAGYASIDATSEEEACEKFRAMDHSDLLADFAQQGDVELAIAGVTPG